MRRAALTVSALVFLACATTQSASQGSGAGPESGAQSVSTDGTVQTTITTQDGTSFERAIVIEASNELEGGPLEYRWVAEHFPGYRMQKQSLTQHNGRPYDVLLITDAAGTEHQVYFDISSFFGKR